MKQKVLVILGPTASGKSALAIQLAQLLNGEVISADSRQVYKGLDIGTGKVTKKEMKGVPHHLLDVADPKEIFNVSDFKKLADIAIAEIIQKNKLPIIVGGTGFYIDAITGKSSLPEVHPNPLLRKKLGEKNAEELFEILKSKDPTRAKSIDKNNKVRLIRALEIIKALGKVPKIKKLKNPYEFIFVGLTQTQEKLDIKIKHRLLARFDQGMIEEAELLHSQGLSYKRMNELGLEYRYLALFLQKKLSEDEMIEKLFIEIRKYSKRQMTYFKTNKQIQWFDPTEEEKVVPFVREAIQG